MEQSLSLYADLKDVDESKKESQTKSKPQIEVPDTILSPPTSRSNSPVADMKFDKDTKGEESDSSDADELVLHDEDVKLQEEQAEEDRKARDEVCSF